MSHDQSAAPDARVAAAAAHWGYRFTSNGTDYGDFTATLARIGRWADWCREWGVTARYYEQLAEAAEDAGRPETANGAWRRASLAWHWGKFVFVDDPVQQRAAQERSVACFRRAAAGMTPPAEPVRIPYQATQLAGYLRVPAATASGQEAVPPVVIMLPGLDSTKEELQATAEYLLARGMATLAIDGPGQGEAAYDLPIEPAYEKVATAVVDYLATRADVDGGNGGLFGVSLGGYYAARAAAREKRLKAVVDLAGPYRFDLDWDEVPEQTRATFRVRSGAASDDEARAKAGTLTLEEAAGEITTPLLILGGGPDDRITPAYHQERLASEVASAELVIYPDGSHGVTNRAYESRSRLADGPADRRRG